MAERERSLPFDRVADSYDATRGGDDRGALVAEALAPWLPPGKLLEIGVGTGVVAGGLKAVGRDVVGVDLSRPMLARARGRLGARVAQGDAQRLPVRDGAVSAVYAVWVLHLVADVGAVLAECVRVIRPGGRCVLVPGRSGRNAGTDVEVLLDNMWQRLRPAGRADTVDRIRSLAAAAGLRVAGHARFHVGPRPFSPDELAARIGDRSYSILWEISEDTWETEIPPLLDRIRALPEPDRHRATGNEYDVLVFQR